MYDCIEHPLKYFCLKYYHLKIFRLCLAQENPQKYNLNIIKIISFINEKKWMSETVKRRYLKRALLTAALANRKTAHALAQAENLNNDPSFY